MEFTEDLVRKLKYIIAGHDNIRDYEIADALGLSKTAYSNRKVQNSIPLEAIIKLCLRKNISINYVFSECSIYNIKDNIAEIDNMIDNLDKLMTQIISQK